LAITKKKTSENKRRGAGGSWIAIKTKIELSLNKVQKSNAAATKYPKGEVGYSLEGKENTRTWGNFTTSTLEKKRGERVVYEVQGGPVGRVCLAGKRRKKKRELLSAG